MGTRTTVDADGKGDPFGRCILAVAQSRDRDSFIRLFNHYAPRVKAYLLKTGSVESEADDLAQEALLAVWRKAPSFDPARAAASTWIFAIARNLRIDMARRWRNADDIEDFAEFLAAGDDPEDDLFKSEAQSLVGTALGKLTEDQRNVIHLSFFEDRPHQEIAERLAIPLGTVKSRLRLAVAKLRQSLAPLS